MSKAKSRRPNVSPESMANPNKLGDAHPMLDGDEMIWKPKGHNDNSRYITKNESEDENKETLEEYLDNLDEEKLLAEEEKLLAEEEKLLAEEEKSAAEKSSGQLREQDTQSSKRQKVA